MTPGEGLQFITSSAVFAFTVMGSKLQSIIFTSTEIVLFM